MRVFEYVMTEAQAGRRLGNILRSEHGFSKTLIARLKHRPGSVFVDGEPARMTDRVSIGARVQIFLEEKKSEGATDDLPALEILYEDADILVINKPAGAKTHPAFGGDYSGTVAAAVSEYLGGGAFHPVTRLDKGTSGAMLIAKNGYMHSLLQKRLHTGALERIYAAATLAAPVPQNGVIDAPLAREEGSARRIVCEGGQRAVTHYRTAKVFADGTALVILRLETGRTHQIRAHMSHIGCPLKGDDFYGAPERGVRPALHSHVLRFTHPTTGERITVCAPPPEDMAEALDGVNSAEYFEQ